eukprot:jgi/Undpi1/6171/HiC_scaffold_20.g08655.m1
MAEGWENMTRATSGAAKEARALTMRLALPVAECPTCSLFFLCQTSHQAPTRRNRRAQGLVAAAGPPDDFIDTTFVEEEGSTYVGVDFERQELRVIFETMDKNNIYYKMLAEDQIRCSFPPPRCFALGEKFSFNTTTNANKTEILQLTQALLSAKQKPVDISKLSEGDSMKGKWKLEFSTEERYKFLPPSADIYNYIYEGKKGGRLDNVIRFNKSWIVKSVRAVTMYEMDTRGKIMFEFDRIEADLLGFKVPLPKLNSDAGFVEVQYFDGDLWIEAFELPTVGDSETTTVVNIYRRVGDATDKDKTYIPERTGKQRPPQR